MTTFSTTPQVVCYSGLKIKEQMDKILSVVSVFYEMPIYAIRADNREQYGVTARHLCMYLMMQIDGCTLKRTAKYFNRTNHTTTIYAIESTKTRMNKDAVFKSQVEKIVQVPNT